MYLFQKYENYILYTVDEKSSWNHVFIDYKVTKRSNNMKFYCNVV